MYADARHFTDVALTRARPNEWFPEYTRPLGAPVGPATKDASGMKWNREFAHASVSVDLNDRTASKIQWHAVGAEFPAFTSKSKYSAPTAAATAAAAAAAAMGVDASSEAVSDISGDLPAFFGTLDWYRSLGPLV